MFYTFNQNNSGGHLVVNKEEGIAHNVIIEANSEEEALEKAIDMGIYFDGCDDGIDCECCGDRWSRYPDENNAPLIYGIDWKEYQSIFLSGKYNTAVVHYLDGSIEWKDENNLISKIK